jgi:ClpP class serine protease
MKRARFAPHGALALHAASWGTELEAPAPPPVAFTQLGAVAVVHIGGPLLQHVDTCGDWDSYEGIRARADQAFASSASTVVLCISSPGGEVAGCFELSEDLRAKAKAAGKRLVAYVDGMAASAAYALACAAEAIYVPAAGLVGSIGTIKVAVDQTGADRAMGLSFAVVSSGNRKADGNPHVAISEETIGAIQAEVDGMAALFFDLVGRARGLAPAAVAGLEAAIFLGASAVSAGLADAVVTFDGLLAMLANGQQATAREGAEAGMNEKEKAIAIAACRAALKATTDEGETEGLKATLKSLGADEGEPDGDEKPKDEDKSKSEAEPTKDEDKSKSEDKSEPAKDEPKDEKKSDAKAALQAVKALAAKIASKEETEERARLMASRPDLSAEVVDLLKRSPLSVVRDAVKSLKGSAKSTVSDARKAITAQHTQGNPDGDLDRDHLPEAEAKDLDVRMGLRRSVTAIRTVGNKLFLGVMKPAEARAEIARRDELARKGASK